MNMMERLAEDEERNSQSNAKVGLGAASGAVIGGSAVGAHEYRKEKKFNDRVNQSVKNTYHDAKDKHIRYQYSKAQSGAIKNNPADKPGAPSRIRQALERRDAYFHPDELDFVNDGFLNDSRKLRGVDYDSLLDQTFGVYRDKPHLNLIPMHLDSNHLIPRMGIGAGIGAVGLGAAAGLAHHYGNRERTAFEASDMMERLAETEEKRSSGMGPVGLGAGAGGAAGLVAGGLSSRRMMMNTIADANEINRQNANDPAYLAAKDKNIRYRYADARNNAVKSRIEGLGQELNFPADKSEWTPEQKAQRTRTRMDIEFDALEREERYFHPEENELMTKGFFNDYRIRKGMEYDEELDKAMRVYKETPVLNKVIPEINIKSAGGRVGLGAVIGAGLGGAAGLAHHYGNRERTTREDLAKAAHHLSEAMERYAINK